MTQETFDAIATRTFEVHGPEGARSARLELGRPVPEGEGESFACPWRIEGWGDGQVRAAYGVDAIQALMLALTIAAAFLYTSEDARAGRLSWEGGENGDLGLPFNETIADLVPARPDGSKGNGIRF